MIAVDTNVLVRYLVQDDPRQSRRAVELITEAQARDEPILVVDIVLCELEWVLEAVYAVPRDAIARTVRRLLSSGHFAFQDAAAVARAVERYENSRGDLSDYLLGENAVRERAGTTYTFDKGLKRQPGFALL